MILSICIPTYNRADYLRECIESLFASIRAAKAEADTEVVVSDNASPDRTETVVQELIGLGYPIKYFRQKTNIGGHENFRAVAELGMGKFVWVFGDDDKVELEAVGRILNAIHDGADAVICNGAVYEQKFQRVVNPRFVKLKENRTFNDSTGPGFNRGASRVDFWNRHGSKELSGGTDGALHGIRSGRQLFHVFGLLGFARLSKNQLSPPIPSC